MAQHPHEKQGRGCLWGIAFFFGALAVILVVMSAHH